MTGLEAWGYGILGAMAAALPVWLACARHYAPRRLKEHEGYIMGWEACSRVRDRLEAQARKEALLNIKSSHPLDVCRIREQALTEPTYCACSSCGLPLTNKATSSVPEHSS